ncbi:phage terminase [Muricomes intestini]|uniref:Phage terminase n=1 Tax=Muricomes intestini TaxID=1796634 RepID=A0A4R3JWY0_9FIRM|nr:phage terminase [Muricomes intestini]
MRACKIKTIRKRTSYCCNLKYKQPNHLIIPKTDTKTVSKINAAIKAAYKEGEAKLKGNSKTVPALSLIKTPLRDGDAERPDDEAYKNTYFVNANATSAPGIVDADLNPILTRSEVYSGLYGRASITFYAFNSSGNKGIACGLNNLQKIRDGESLGGKASAEGRVCYGGLDLSSTTDITAFVLVFPPLDEEDKFSILPFFWIPGENVDLRVRRDHVPYDVWKKQGYLNTTEGNVVHYGYIEKFIEKLEETFNIREIAFYCWGAVQMVQNLEGMGFTVVPFGQGFKDMSPPTKELVKLTLEKRIAHSGQPVLRWMMDNIFIKSDLAGNIKPDKEKSTEKIDGVVATIMALDRAIRCGNDNNESVYDDKGILFL